MLKLFRKIRQRLVKENKFSKYLLYAIGEIILVMVGILLALQVNNWNNNRADRNQEVKYLNNIQLDLQKDLKSLAFQINFRREKNKSTETVLAHINGTPISDISEVTKNVVHTIMEERFTPNNTTFTELSNSGNLNLISNDAIKILLLELQELYKYNQFGIDHETYDYREYISKPIFKYTNIEQLMPVFAGQKTAAEQQITATDFIELFSNPEYKNGLVIINLISLDFITAYEIIEAKSKKIIEMIASEID